MQQCLGIVIEKTMKERKCIIAASRQHVSPTENCTLGQLSVSHQPSGHLSDRWPSVHPSIGHLSGQWPCVHWSSVRPVAIRPLVICLASGHPSIRHLSVAHLHPTITHSLLYPPHGKIKELLIMTPIIWCAQCAPRLLLGLAILISNMPFLYIPRLTFV